MTPGAFHPGTHDGLPENQPAGGAVPRTWRASPPEEGPEACGPGLELHLGCLVGIKCRNVKKKKESESGLRNWPPETVLHSVCGVGSGAYACHSTHVEVRGQLAGVGFLLSLLFGL